MLVVLELYREHKVSKNEKKMNIKLKRTKINFVSFNKYTT